MEPQQAKPFEKEVERIFFVRHGDYDPCSGALSPLGRSKVKLAGESMRNFLIPGASFNLFSSNERRAIETAFEIEEVLREKVHRSHPGRLDGVSYRLNLGDRDGEPQKLIKEFSWEAREKNVILVGHKEVLGIFPGFYAKTFLNKTDIPTYAPLEYGGVSYLDLKTGEYRKL